MSVKELGSCDVNGVVELNEVCTDNLNISTSSMSNCWTLNELVPVTSIKCIIPDKIVIFMRTIEKLMSSHGMEKMEFGAFLKGTFSNGILNVDGNSHYIPKQKVSFASVDFEEDPPTSDFNGVIHRHPTGCKSFSGVDDVHINRNFEFSLLYEGNNIVKGIINIKCDNIRIQLPLDIEIQYPIFQVDNPEFIFQKIEKDVPSYVGQNNFQLEKRSFPDLLNQDLLLFNDDSDEELVDEESDDIACCPRCGENIDPELYPI